MNYLKPKKKKKKVQNIIIIYKIVHLLYASWNKCKCIMNVKHVTFFFNSQKCGVTPNLNLIFKKTLA
jgi:hypothetical protein